MSIKNTIIRNIVNIPGWSTKRHIVIFESDDWGSIRTTSREIRDKMMAMGYPMSSFSSLDSIESNDDMVGLFDILTKHCDCNGNNACFTGVCITGNPDFDKIQQENYTSYHWEKMTDTLKRYSKRDCVEKLYHEGIDRNIFIPIFHGREHLNAQRWLRHLQEKNKSVLTAFKMGVTGIDGGINGEMVGDFQAAFDLDSPSDLPFMATMIREGITTFKDLWGYNPSYFVPTNGPFNNSLQPVLKECGIKYIYADRIQNEPLGYGKYARHYHYIGMVNKYDQLCITRNGFFEPSIKGGGLSIQPLENCLLAIERAFRWNKPAIISSHRVNYVGNIEPKNRDHNLKLLDSLLTQIEKRWPDVEYMSTIELGRIIKGL